MIVALLLKRRVLLKVGKLPNYGLEPVIRFFAAATKSKLLIRLVLAETYILELLNRKWGSSSERLYFICLPTCLLNKNSVKDGKQRQSKRNVDYCLLEIEMRPIKIADDKMQRRIKFKLIQLSYLKEIFFNSQIFFNINFKLLILINVTVNLFTFQKTKILTQEKLKNVIFTKWNFNYF